MNLTNKKYSKTIKGLISRIYSSQRSNSKQRNHSMPTYTNKWLQTWVKSQPNFQQLYNDWLNSNYDKMFKPSVDRKNDLIGYTKDNIQLMTWKENCRKPKIVNTKPCKSIHPVTGVITYYNSVTAACKINNGNITNCLNKRTKTSAGLYWEYV